MINIITGDDVFSEVLMMRNVSPKIFLILEGGSDCNMLDPHIATDFCETLPAHSKQAVIRAVELAEEQSIPNVVGLVDRDWIGFGEQEPSGINIFFTDLYDLEATVLFVANIVDRFFAAQTERSSRQRFLTRSGDGRVVDLLARLALPVGMLRFISYKDGYALAMRRFPAHVALNNEMLSINLTTLITTARGRTKPPPEVTEVELLQKLTEAIRQVVDAKDYCSGHDMACCLMFVLAKKFAATMSVDVMLGSIRAMLSLAELQATRFFMELDEWAAQHHTHIWNVADPSL